MTIKNRAGEDIFDRNYDLKREHREQDLMFESNRILI